MNRIAIIGLGQIGGSMVLALRRSSAPYYITGIDVTRRRLHLLGKYLDEGATSWKAAEQADLAVLCIHYEKILEYLRQAGPDQLLLDVCSGKEKIVRFANRRKLRFIGGHPLAGNEHVGEKGWQQDLFESAPFFICPAVSTQPSDVTAVKKFIQDLGGRTVRVDPAAHDRFLAMSSHFPAFLSALLRKTSQSVPAIFRGPGYDSMTRLSRTSPQLLETFLQSNGGNIRKCALQLRRELNHWLKDHHKGTKSRKK